MKLICLLLVACQLPPPTAPSTPDPADVVANSTYRVDIEVLNGDVWEPGGSGTAWIAVNDSESHLITAGHVCKHDPLVPTTYTLVSRDGTKTTAEIENQSAMYDLCLLSAAHISPALPIAAFDPVYDEPLLSVGAPLGVYGCDGGSTHDECGMAPITRGWYAGGNLVSVPMAAGNSGSAVLTAGGVIGVLVEGYRGFDSLSFIESRAHLLLFLHGSGY